MENDQLGTRLKNYESFYNQRLLPKLPVVVRCDGKNFSKFTKGLKRPYDTRLQDLMDEVTKFLVEETNSIVGYTQSDEITLILYDYGKPNSEIAFNGKINKLNSIFAALATAKFNKLLSAYLPEKANKLPVFDCRAFNVPLLEEAVNCLVWRELDATKNSISMAAQYHFSHKSLQNKNGKEMQEMLWKEKNINFNDYPTRFKRGAYFKRVVEERTFTASELETLPAKHEARKNPYLKIKRSIVKQIHLPQITKIVNRVDMIFFDAEPKIAEKSVDIVTIV